MYIDLVLFLDQCLVGDIFLVIHVEVQVLRAVATRAVYGVLNAGRCETSWLCRTGWQARRTVCMFELRGPV